MGDSLQDDMVAFETRWFRFGGGPSEEIFARFGMNDRLFFGQLDELINGDINLNHVTSNDLDEMRAVVRRRLWLVS